MKKIKILFSLVIFCLVFFALCMSASASEEGLTGTFPNLIDWEYDTETKTLYITPNANNKNSGYGFTINGQDFVKNPFWAWRKDYAVYADAVEHIHVSDSFTNYFSYQHSSSIFANWKNLKTIYLGKLKTISGNWQTGSYWAGIGNFENTTGSGAFANNPNLTTVYGYGQTAEEGTVNLSQLYFDRAGGVSSAYNTKYMLYGAAKVEKVILPTTIDNKLWDNMFNGCTSLKTVEIPTWATAIDAKAFYNCSSFVGASVTIGSGDSQISANALVVPAGVKNIAANAFVGTNISAVKLLGTDTVIEKGAFPTGATIYCPNKDQQAALSANGYNAVYYVETVSSGYQTNPKDESIVWYTWKLDTEGTLTFTSNGYDVAGGNSYTAFRDWRAGIDNSLVKKIIFQGKTQYGKIIWQHYTHVLSNWPNVEFIHLSKYTYNLSAGWTGSGIFQNNPKLKTVYFADSEYNAEGNINLAHLTVLIHDSTDDTIGINAFNGCESFSSINIPSFITSIGANAFKNCTSLKSIELPAALVTIKAAAFSGSGIEEIRIHSTDAENFSMDTAAFDDASKVKAYVYSNAMKDLLVESCGFAEENVSVILEGSFGDGSLDWEITGGVLTISGEGESLSFGDSVSVDDLSLIPWSGNASDITKVVITAPITAVSDYALAGLSNLKSVEIPNTLTDFSAKGLFYGANDLESVYVTGFAEVKGAIDLFYGTTFSAELFEGCATDANVYLGKLTSFGFIDSWKEDLSSLGICTYPTSTLATAIRARDDIALTYLPESHDSTLARSGATTVGDIFNWEFVDETETLKLDAANNTLVVNKNNRDEWYAWRDVWKDAIVHARVDKTDGAMYSNNGEIFKNLKNLVSVHFETMTNFYFRNFPYGYGYFNGCSSLTTISMGADDTIDGVIDLSRCVNWQNEPETMFYGCSSITKVILPDNIRMINGSNVVLKNTIAPDMFANCTSLRELVIPACFDKITKASFAGCTALEKLYIMSPEIDFSEATSTTFPASEKLTIFVTSDKVKNDIEALGIAKIKIVNIGAAINSEGFSIRLNSYNGLRGIFSYDNAAGAELEALGYTLKEYGVIVCSESTYDTNSGAYLMNSNGNYVTNANAIKKVAVFDGEKYYKTLDPDSIPDADPNRTYFAATVVNYKNNFKSGVYMTEYAVYTDTEGNDFFAYSNYGETNPDYKFTSLFGMTMDMFIGGADMTGADEVAVWNTVLQGALEGYYEAETSTNGVTVTIVNYNGKNYAFVRSENGTEISDELVASSVSEIGFEGEIEASFGLEIADMGTTAPVDNPSSALVSKVTTPNRYSGADMAQHCQGICTDGTYMYYSFTGKIVKVRMSDGVEVGTMTVTKDFNKYDAHMGNLICHDGKLFISVLFWDSDKQYIGVCDTDAIVGDVTTDIVKGVYYQDAEDITLFAGTDKETKDQMYGGTGLDSITIGKIPGGGFILPDGSEIEDNKDYLVFAAGSAYQHPTTRHDDDYLRLRFVDIDEVLNRAETLNSAKVESIEEPLTTKYTAFAYAGATCVQCVTYDKDTGDYHFATYGRDAGLDDAYPSYDYFVADGSKKLCLTEIYVGQNTPEDSDIYEISIERAAQYKDKADLDLDGNTEEQMLGWTMDLRCVCGRHYINNHDAIDYDNSGYAGRICGMAHPGMADQGIASVGNDYFYVSYYNNKSVDGVTYYGQDAILYRLDRYNGSWKFTTVK